MKNTPHIPPSQAQPYKVDKRRPVTRTQRFHRDNRCPICGGGEDLPSGHGIRCWGFVSDDDTAAFCTQGEAEHGDLAPVQIMGTDHWVHDLDGFCACGAVDHRVYPATATGGVRANKPTTARARGAAIGGRRIVEVNHFTDADGNLLYDEVRYEPKEFRERRPPRKGDPLESYYYDGFVYNMDGVKQRVPYKLPLLLEALPTETIYLVEGAGKAECLLSEGVLATACLGGAGKWNDELSKWLAGRRIVLLPDKDEKGIRHVQAAAESLLRFDCDVLTMPPFDDVPERGDIKDWLRMGHTVEELEDWVRTVQAAATGEPPYLTLTPETDTSDQHIPNGKHTDAKLAQLLEQEQQDKQEKQGKQRQQRSTRESDRLERAVGWPEPPRAEAYYGVLGRIAYEAEPFIESDSGPLLVNLLTTSGVAMGHSAFLQVGPAQQYAILDTINTGATGDNKTDALNPIRAMRAVWPEPEMLGDEGGDLSLVQSTLPTEFSGLSTGEGLLWQVRDETKARGGTVTDPGIEDKRLLIVEEEFARPMAAMRRETNTLPSTLRKLFDCPHTERSSPKNGAIVVTKPHVGMIAQITPRELVKVMRELEHYNGFANRLLYTVGHRVRPLPNPPDYREKAKEHAVAWDAAIVRAQKRGEMRWSPEAAAVWAGGVYEQLRVGGYNGLPERKGLMAEICARAHVHVQRMALIFAALDEGTGTLILEQHLLAALAVWEWLERCAMFIFGRAPTVSVAGTILTALAAAPGQCLTRMQVTGLFARHVPAEAIGKVLEALQADGLVARVASASGNAGGSGRGRPVEMWVLVRGENADNDNQGSGATATGATGIGGI